MFNINELGLSSPPREPWDNDDNKLQRTNLLYISDGLTHTNESYSLTHNWDETFLESNRDYLLAQIWRNANPPIQSMYINNTLLPDENFEEPIVFNEDYTRNVMPIDLIQSMFPQTQQQRILPLYPDQSSPFSFQNVESVPYLYGPENYFTYQKYPTHIQFQLVTYFIEGKNINGNINAQDESFTTQIIQPSGDLCNVNIEVDSEAPCRYTCTFYASEPGVYNGHVHILGEQNINGSPFKISVTRKYCATAKAKIIVGAQPIENGLTGTNQKRQLQLWGIDVDHFSKKIYICDKKLDRIRILSCEGIPLAEVGKKGSGQNKFDQPTGIAVDQINKRLIVSDKDNHRICFLTLDGEFIKTFGRKGHRDGELNYPWGIAVSPNGELIAVADTRNHRIQLYDKNGDFLRKYSVFETNPYEYKKQFDYPSGVCFDNMGQHIYVSDFNLNIVFMLNIELTEKTILVPQGRILRPQGLVVDIAGNILICDSSNNCVRVVSPNGVLLCSINGNGQLIHTPQDLSILRDGLLTIVDSKGVVLV